MQAVKGFWQQWTVSTCRPTVSAKLKPQLRNQFTVSTGFQALKQGNLSQN
jgi:hypothetical protein